MNRLALEGMPFRDAYKEIGMQVQKGEYKPDRHIRHTHAGSIGNLCNDRITARINEILSRF